MSPHSYMYYIENSSVKTIHAVILVGDVLFNDLMVQNLPVNDINFGSLLKASCYAHYSDITPSKRIRSLDRIE